MQSEIMLSPDEGRLLLRALEMYRMHNMERMPCQNGGPYPNEARSAVDLAERIQQEVQGADIYLDI